MSEHFFAKRRSFGLTNAIIILMVVFFFVPFAMRGARMALQKTENNIKDWLPDSFHETEELAWFAKQFVSEQFILATWPGCHDNDQRLVMLTRKLQAESLPKIDPTSTGQNDFYRARQMGTDLALFVEKDLHYDWGGQNEKWLVDESSNWYYLTPQGKLFRWDGKASLPGYLWRQFQRSVGSFRLRGQFVAAFGSSQGEGDKNPFYREPGLLSAPLFKTIETGPEVVQQLAGENGSLYRPGQEVAAQRDAIDRLTGTLFSPPVPSGFAWDAAAMKEHLGAEFVATFPEGWRETLEILVSDTAKELHSGDRDKLIAASPLQQSKLWYKFFDTIAVEPPPRQTCVVVTLSDVARRNLKRVIGRGMLGSEQGRLLQLAVQCGIAAPPIPTMAPPPFSWLQPDPPVVEPALRIGGPPVDNVAIDEEGTITLVRLLGYSVVLGLGLSYFCLRSVKLTFMVFFVGGVSAVACLSFVWWCNASVDAILLTMPSLVYVLGMSGAIHIINYYRDTAIESGADGAAEHAVSHALIPCSLATFTTAIGLISLCTSNILPIRKFGIFSAMGVIATLLLLFLYLPAALTAFPPKLPTRKPSKKIADGDLDEKKHERFVDVFWAAIGAWIVRNQYVVNAFSLLLMFGIGYGVLKIETSVQLLKMFDKDAQIIQDYRWLENNFGRLVPMELVVRFPDDTQRPTEQNPKSDQDPKLVRSQLNLLERAETVARIQQVVETEFGYEGQDVVGRGMSAITMLRDLPDPSRGFAATRTAFDRLLQEAFPQLLNTDFLRIEKEKNETFTELWRISLRLGALNDVDYGQFVTRIKRAVEPVVAAYHCREDVIQQVVASSSESNRRVTGKVLVLGMPRPESRTAAIDRNSNLSTDKAPSAGTKNSKEVVPIDGLKIFAETLSACLTNESVRQTMWHDPVAFPVTQDPEKLKRWGEYIKGFDCVVLVQSSPEYDINFIRENNPSFIDYSPVLNSVLAGGNANPSESDAVGSVMPQQGVDVVYTGVVPVVYKAQRTLLESLIESIIWAFVLIAGVMMILLTPSNSILGNLNVLAIGKAVSAGAFSMLPNIFPVMIIFGAMGLIGIQVDIGSMMTASVALGVAVDDTIHYLTWFRGGMRNGLPRKEAVLYAYSRVAPAMTQTTIIGGIGLSVFALSTFTPTQRFGTLMLALLSTALIGDLIFLPALLASPIGKLFEPSDRTKKNSQSHSNGEAGDLVGDNGSYESMVADTIPITSLPEANTNKSLDFDVGRRRVDHKRRGESSG